MTARSQKRRREALKPTPPVVKTKAEQYASAVESLEFYEDDLRRSLEHEKAGMLDYAGRLTDSKLSPQGEMEWGDKLFKTAAQIEVLSWLFAHRDTESKPAWRRLRDYMLEDASREARSTSMSTGQSHNLAVRHKMAAQFDLCDRELDYLVKCEAKVESLAFEIEAEQSEKLASPMDRNLEIELRGLLRDSLNARI